MILSIDEARARELTFSRQNLGFIESIAHTLQHSPTMSDVTFAKYVYFLRVFFPGKILALTPGFLALSLGG